MLHYYLYILVMYHCDFLGVMVVFVHETVRVRHSTVL